MERLTLKGYVYDNSNFFGHGILAMTNKLQEYEDAEEHNNVMIDEQYCFQTCGATEHCKECNRLCNGDIDYYENYDFMAEEHNNGWIPCSERLPDKYCHCLVTRRNDYEDGSFDSDVREDVWIELEGVWGWQSKFEGLIDEVIAWMPLPAPYMPKGEQP